MNIRELRFLFHFFIGFFIWWLSLIMLVDTPILMIPISLWFQVRLFTLGHEGVHRLLSKNKVLNSIFSRIFCYYPLFMSYTKYRKMHLLHHKYLGSAYDPDLNIVKRYAQGKGEYFKSIFMDFITFKSTIRFINFYTDISELKEKKENALDYKRDLTELFLYWFFLILLIFIYGGLVKFLIIWLIPIMILPFILEFYVITQHYTPNGDDKFIRNVKVNPIIAFFLFPLGTNMHKAHHEYVAMPWYELKDKINFKEEINFGALIKILKT